MPTNHRLVPLLSSELGLTELLAAFPLSPADRLLVQVHYSLAWLAVA